MNQQQAKKNSSRLGALSMALALVAACGGRAITIDDGGSAGYGATISYAGTASAEGGSSSAHGGTSSTYGGTTSFAGSQSTDGGSTASGGATGFAGTSGSAGCGPTTCPFVPACVGPNQMLVTLPGQCCPTCESTCAQQICGAVVCPGGSTLRMIAGQCCPICVVDDCDAGRMFYETEQLNLTPKYSVGCSTDADCVSSALSNACEGGCGATSILKAAVQDWETNLDSAAISDCSNCPQGGPAPPCLAPPPPKCSHGQCTLGD